MSESKSKEISILVNPFNETDIYTKVGYSIDESGYLIDEETKERVKAEDGSEININVDKEFALIGGSHTFVRNIAGYSQYLTKKGLLKLKEE